MGSHSLEMEIKAKNSEQLKKKFYKIKDQCTREYGTDPYNGTWSTIPGVKIISDPFPEMKSWTKKKKYKVIDYLLNHSEKWENALAVKTRNSYLIAGWAVS